MRGLALVVFALAGCIEPSLVDCGDGTSCPSGSRCDALHTTCVMPEQDAVCTGQTQFAPCSTSIFNGACYDEVCLPAGCGNNILDPDEVCDDGNVSNDDMCSSDCRSDLQCGTGVTDDSEDEQCDDGNRASHDGCDSNCLLETETWTLVPFGPDQLGVLGTLNDPIVYDSVHRQLLVLSATYAWTFDGEAWALIRDIVPPPGEMVVAATYDDTLRQQPVGVFARTLGVDLRPWTGAGWGDSIGGLALPGGYSVQAAVRDPLRDEVVIIASDGLAIRTFVVSATSSRWIEPISEILHEPELAYDAASQQVVLLAENLTLTGAVAYALDGELWKRLEDPPSRPVANGWSLATVRGTVWAVNAPASEVWQREGDFWKLVEVPPIPMARTDGLILHDQSTDALTYIEGRVHSHLVADTWVTHYAPEAPEIAAIDGTLRLVDAGLPPRVFDLSSVGWTLLPPSTDLFVADPLCTTARGRGTIICVSGGATFEYDGATWRELRLVGTPPVVSILGEDLTRRRLVLVSDVQTYALDDSGGVWRYIGEAPNTSLQDPAFDARNDSLVSATSDRIYELADDTWTDVAIGPDGGYVAVADERRGNVVLFAIRTGTIWERVGLDWQLRGMLPTNSAALSGANVRETGTTGVILRGFNGIFALVGEWTSSSQFEVCGNGTDDDGDTVADELDDDCYWYRDECPPFTTCQ